MTYEIDFPRNIPNWNMNIIGMLTGLSFTEIYEASPKSERWRSRDLKNVINSLGFNAEKFEKFDPKTDKPVILRTSFHKESKNWFSWVYYDGFVYGGSNKYDLEDWKKEYSDLKITTMLKVWI